MLRFRYASVWARWCLISSNTYSKAVDSRGVKWKKGSQIFSENRKWNGYFIFSGYGASEKLRITINYFLFRFGCDNLVTICCFSHQNIVMPYVWPFWRIQVFSNLRVKVINDCLNEFGHSGLKQSVLFHTAAKRKMPASSLSAIPTLIQSSSQKQVGLSLVQSWLVMSCL